MSVGDRFSKFAADDAVSNIVGTVLILAITVAAFGGLAMTVFDEVGKEDRAPRADIQIQKGTGGFVVQHRGGEAIEGSDAKLVIFTTAGAKSCDLSTISAIGPNGRWDIGESLDISAIYTADGSEAITGVQVIYKGSTSAILSSSGATSATPTASCSSSTAPGGPGSVKKVGAGEACQDLDNNGVCDGNDAILTIGKIPDCKGATPCVANDSIGIIVTDPNSGLIIPATTGEIDNNGGGNLYFEAPKNVLLDADMKTGGGSTSGGHITIVSKEGNINAGGKSVSNGQGSIFMTAAGHIDVSGANLRATGNGAKIVLTAGGNVDLTSSVLWGATTEISANAAGQITQTGAEFKADKPRNVLSSCVKGTLKSGSLSWEQAQTQCSP